MGSRGIAHAAAAVLAVAFFSGCGLIGLGDYSDFRIEQGFSGSPTGTGASGGANQASDFGWACVGSIDSTPDHQILVDADTDLLFYVESEADTTLVVTGHGGTFCDDDSHGDLNPMVNARLAAGEYDVYIGDFGGDDRYTRYALTIMPGDESMPRTGEADAAASEELDGEDYADFLIEAGPLDTLTGTGISGGSDSADRFGEACRGYIHSEPEHLLTLTSARTLSLRVESEADTTLVLRGPAGTFCDDDGGGDLNPSIDAHLVPGEYQVHVGDFGDYERYTLYISDQMEGGLTTSTPAQESPTGPLPEHD